MTTITHETLTIDNEEEPAISSAERAEFEKIATLYEVHNGTAIEREDVLDYLIEGGDSLVQAEISELSEMYKDRSTFADDTHGTWQHFVMRNPAKPSRADERFAVYHGNDGTFKASCVTDFGRPEELRYNISVENGECHVYGERYSRGVEAWVEESDAARETTLRRFYGATLHAFNEHQSRSKEEKQQSNESARDIQERLSR